MDEHDETQGMQEEGQEATEPQGEGTDYKALYEKTLAESRKWEKRAKAGKPSDAERITQLEAQVASLTESGARAEVAAAKGVPVELVTGSTREEMEASADALIKWRGGYPQTRDAGEVAAGARKKTPAESFGEAFDTAFNR